MLFFFFFNDTATTEIYTLSLHDALPIFRPADHEGHEEPVPDRTGGRAAHGRAGIGGDPHDHRRLPRGLPHHRRHGGRRSEEHTSELQSRQYLVCRLLLEKKKIYILYR